MLTEVVVAYSGGGSLARYLPSVKRLGSKQKKTRFSDQDLNPGSPEYKVEISVNISAAVFVKSKNK
jgi:hypothetical protein